MPLSRRRRIHGCVTVGVGRTEEAAPRLADPDSETIDTSDGRVSIKLQSDSAKVPLLLRMHSCGLWPSNSSVNSSVPTPTLIVVLQAQISKVSVFKVVSKRLLRRLSSLPLAIAEMGVIAALSAVGTIIEQNKPIQFYIDSYPDGDHKACILSALQ